MKTVMYQKTEEKSILFICEDDEEQGTFQTYLYPGERFFDNLFTFLDECDQSSIQIKMLFRSLERNGIIKAVI